MPFCIRQWSSSADLYLIMYHLILPDAILYQTMVLFCWPVSYYVPLNPTWCHSVSDNGPLLLTCIFLCTTLSYLMPFCIRQCFASADLYLIMYHLILPDVILYQTMVLFCWPVSYYVPLNPTWCYSVSEQWSSSAGLYLIMYHLILPDAILYQTMVLFCWPVSYYVPLNPTWCHSVSDNGPLLLACILIGPEPRFIWT
jgi:hypothetical protein